LYNKGEQLGKKISQGELTKKNPKQDAIERKKKREEAR
jgi:hypothetical protein